MDCGFFFFPFFPTLNCSLFMSSINVSALGARSSVPGSSRSSACCSAFAELFFLCVFPLLVSPLVIPVCCEIHAAAMPAPFRARCGLFSFYFYAPDVLHHRPSRQSFPPFYFPPTLILSGTPRVPSSTLDRVIRSKFLGVDVFFLLLIPFLRSAPVAGLPLLVMGFSLRFFLLFWSRNLRGGPISGMFQIQCRSVSGTCLVDGSPPILSSVSCSSLRDWRRQAP